MPAKNTEYVYQLQVTTLNTEAPAEIGKNPAIKSTTMKNKAQAEAILKKAAGHALDTFNPANNNQVSTIKYDAKGFEIHYLNDDGNQCVQTGTIQACALN